MKDKNEDNNIIEETSYNIIGLTPLEKCFNQVEGLEEWFKEGIIQLIPLETISENGKFPKKPLQLYNESWPHYLYTLHEWRTKCPNANVGIKLGKGIGCIDIDGVGEGDSKIQSIEYIHNTFMKLDIFKECLVVRTANGGIHIYFRYDSENDIIKAHEIVKKFRFGDDCPIPELRGMPLGHAIEIFDGRKILSDGTETCNRFMVFVASSFNGKSYEVISEQKDIRKIPIIDDVEAEVEKAFLLEGFTYYVDYSKFEFNEFEFKDNRNTVPIPDENIQRLSWFLGDLYKSFHLKRCKHYATLALGGYLKRHTDYDSAFKLGQGIVDYCGYLFEDSDAFLKTLLHDFGNPPKDVNAQGGHAFYNEFCSDLIDYNVFWEALIFLMGGNLRFCIGDKSAKKTDYIILNREKGKVILNSYDERNKKNGDYYHVLTSTREILGVCPVSLEKVINPLNHEDNRLILRCVSNMGVLEIEAKDSDSLLAEIKSRSGVVLNVRNFSDVSNHIINKFYELDLVEENEKSSLAGVFIVDGKLVRYDVNGDGVPIVKPDSVKIADALALIEDIIKIIPHHEEEIGLLLRKYFIYPFHYYFKSKRRQIKYILLSGAGGTLKSTLGEMCLSVYQDIIKEGGHSNVIGGGGFDSPYRMGRAMEKGTMGFLVNEPDSAFTEPHLLEILKDSTSNLLSRNVYGVEFYAYQSPLFASNIDLPLRTEFIRRQVAFNFTPSYVVNGKTMNDLASLLNVDGVQNKRFEELHVIGDYILWFVSENLDILDLDYDSLELSIVEALENISSKDLSWMKMSKSDMGYADEDSESYEEYDDALDIFVHELMDIYNKNQKTFIMTREVESVIGSVDLYEGSVLKLFIRKGYYPFLSLFGTDDDMILITDKGLRKLFKRENLSGITGPKFCEEYLEVFKDNYSPIVSSSHRRYDGKGVKSTKVPIKFILDLMNGKARF